MPDTLHPRVCPLENKAPTEDAAVVASIVAIRLPALASNAEQFLNLSAQRPQNRFVFHTVKAASKVCKHCCSNLRDWPRFRAAVATVRLDSYAIHRKFVV